MDPLRRMIEPTGQHVMPGAEASSRQALAHRARQPMRGRVPQRGLGDAETPLFDVAARAQLPLFTRDPRISA